MEQNGVDHEKTFVLRLDPPERNCDLGFVMTFGFQMEPMNCSLSCAKCMYVRDRKSND